MAFLKLLFGFVLFFLAVGYLFYPRLIISLNHFFREYFFNDTFIITRRRRVGLLFLLLSLLGFYMGITAWRTEPVGIKTKNFSPLEQKLSQGRHFYISRKYDLMLKEYKAALVLDGNNLEAMKGLGLAHLMLGEKKKARIIWEQALKLSPGDAYLNRCLARLKKSK